MRHVTAKRGWAQRYDDVASWPAKTLAWAWNTVLTWQSRSRDRVNLSRLDDHLLKDVGLHRSDIQPEIDKPFWMR